MKAVTCQSAARQYVDLVTSLLLNLVQSIHLRELLCFPCVWHVSLVRIYEQNRVLQLVVHDHVVELSLRRLDLGIIRGVDNVDHSLRVLIVCVPCGPEVLLATKVPDLQLEILVGNFLDITPNSGLCYNNLVESKLIEDSCLPRVVHAHNDDLELRIAANPAQPVPELGENASHLNFLF